MSPDSPSKKEKSSKSAGTGQARAQQATVTALEAQVAQLLSEREATRTALADSQDDVASLRMAITALRSELLSVRESVERVTSDLKTSATQPLTQVRSELQAATSEALMLKAQYTTIESSLGSLHSTQQEHAHQLQDVAVLRTQQSLQP